MGNKKKSQKRKSKLQLRRLGRIIYNKARERLERERQERQLADGQDGADEQNSTGLEGTSETPQVEKPKNKQERYKPKPVEILGSLESRALRTRPENLSYAMRRPEKKRYAKKRRRSSEGAQWEGTESVGSLSIDGAQSEGVDNEDSLLLARASGPPQPVTKKVRQFAVKTTKRGRPRKIPRNGDEDEGGQPKKIKKRRQYKGAAIIAKVYHFLKKEYEYMKSINGPDCDLTPLANVLHRTALATGVSDYTVRVILDEERRLLALMEEMTEDYGERREEDLDCGSEDPGHPSLDTQASLPDPDPEVTDNSEPINIVKVEFVDEESEMISAVASITPGDQGYRGLQRATDVYDVVNSVTGYQDKVTEVNSAVDSVTEGDKGYQRVTEPIGNMLMLEVAPPALGMPALVPTVSTISSNVKTEPINEPPETIADVNMTTLDNTPHIDPLMTPDIDLPSVKTEPPDDASISTETGSAEMSHGPPPVAIREIGSTLFVTYTDD